MRTQAFDIAIVGYGPTGLALANWLGKAGHSCVVIERWPNLYALPRAGHIDGEVMRLFQKMGIAADLALRSSVVRQTMILGADGEKIMEVLAQDCDQGWDAHYSMFQPEFEHLLDRQVRSCDCVTVLQGWRLEKVQAESAGFRLHIAQGSADGPAWIANGAVNDISARWLIGADGANSAVRSYADTDQFDYGHKSRALVIFAERLDPAIGASMPDSEVGMQISHPYVALRASGNRFARWEFHLHEDEPTAEMNEPRKAWELIAPWGFNPENAKLVRNSVFEFRTLVADTWRSGNILLAGDAAHLMPPHQGQGLCSGQRDAAALAWRLDLILRGVADDRLLESYTPERKPHVVALTLNSAERAQVFWITDPAAARTRDEKMRAANASGNLMQSYGEVPPLTSGVFHGAPAELKAPVGHLSPQYRVSIAGAMRLLDDYIGFNWSIVTVDPNLIESLCADEGILSQLNVRLALIEREHANAALADPNEDYFRWFAANKCKAMLLRPDSYIFGVANSVAELKELITSCAEQLHLRPFAAAQ